MSLERHCQDDLLLQSPMSRYFDGQSPLSRYFDEPRQGFHLPAEKVPNNSGRNVADMNALLQSQQAQRMQSDVWCSQDAVRSQAQLRVPESAAIAVCEAPLLHASSALFVPTCPWTAAPMVPRQAPAVALAHSVPQAAQRAKAMPDAAVSACSVEAAFTGSTNHLSERSRHNLRSTENDDGLPQGIFVDLSCLREKNVPAMAHGTYSAPSSSCSESEAPRQKLSRRHRGTGSATYPCS